MRTSILTPRSATPEPRAARWASRWASRGLAWAGRDERSANRTVWGAWAITRLLLLLGLVVGKNYCDPEFYYYAGKLSLGQLPYAHVPVEYPPLAMLLILLPALPLLPFAAIAPRPDAAFSSLASLPQPHDLFRYGAFGISFGVEMLLIDAATLWLVRRAARRMLPGDKHGVSSGLLYVVLIFASGALLQKFDLAAGALCLLALVALAKERPALAWGAVAAATLVKGYPLLLVLPLAAYAVTRAAREANQHGMPLWQALLDRRGPLACGALAFGAVIAAPTVLVVAVGGVGAVAHTLQAQGARAAEIESLYANALLLLGWLPGVTVRTAFAPDGLSRIIATPSTGWVGLASAVVLVVLLTGICAALMRAARHGGLLGGGRRARARGIAVAGIGAAALLLAFIVSFRALPAHYVLAVLPLAAVIRLRNRSLERLWIGSLLVVALLGQVVAALPVWHALVAFVPWAVLLLTLRNIAWVVAFGTLLVSLWQWSDPALRTGSWGIRHEGRREPDQAARRQPPRRA